jgi:2-oxoisovalerate dehydrogenase E1 component
MRAQAKPAAPAAKTQPDWRRVVSLVQRSRAMDAIEEQELVPGKKIFYQFSARGHDMAQVLLGLQLTHPKDAICGYYRSRPILI